MILVIGLFNAQKRRSIITQGEEMALMLKGRGVKVLTVSNHTSIPIRLVDTFFTIIFKARAYKIGVVQFYGSLSIYLELASVLLLRLMRKKVILTLHGGGIPDRMPSKGRMYKLCFRLAHKITAPSAFLIEALKPFGVNAELLENIIHLDQYKPVQKSELKPRLIWMRAYHDIYNPAMAVRVVEILRKRYPDITLEMFGPDQGQKQAITDIIASKGLQEHIKVNGIATLEDKNRMPVFGDVYISTNRLDNAPVSFLEMMALGIPVVTTNIGGIPYYIRQGETGMLADLDNDVAMADAVAELLEDKILAQRIIANGFAMVRNYTPERVYAKWVDIFNRTLID